VSGSREVLLPLLLVVGALLRGGIMLLLSAEDGWEEAKEWDDCIMVLINKLVCGCGRAGGRRRAPSGLRAPAIVCCPDSGSFRIGRIQYSYSYSFKALTRGGCYPYTWQELFLVI